MRALAVALLLALLAGFRAPGMYSPDTTPLGVTGVRSLAPEALAQNQRPTAAFTPASGDSQTVVADGSASSDPDGSIAYWTWDWGDGSPPVTEGDPIAFHVYDLFGGLRTIQLIVTDAAGGRDTTETDIYIKAPVVSDTSFTVSGTLSEGETVTLTIGTGFGVRDEYATIDGADQATWHFDTWEDGNHSNNEGKYNDLYPSSDPAINTSTFPQRHSRSTYNLMMNFDRDEADVSGPEKHMVVFEQSASYLARRWYTSFYVYFDPATWTPDDGWDDGDGVELGNNKIFRFSNHVACGGLLQGIYLDIGEATGVAGWTTPLQQYPWYYFSPAPATGVWHQWELEADMAGNVRLYMNGGDEFDYCDGGGCASDPNFDGICGSNTSGLAQIFFSGFSTTRNENPDDDWVVMDDLVADPTWARVMLGDADTWAACTFREYQPVVSWEDDEIVLTLNQGAFDTSDTPTIYVVNADGEIVAKKTVTIQ